MNPDDTKIDQVLLSLMFICMLSIPVVAGFAVMLSVT